jgi:hypothetical protein
MARVEAISHHEIRRTAQTFTVNLPSVNRVRLRHPQQLPYFGALGALAAAEIIEWPIALVLAAGHEPAENQHNKVAPGTRRGPRRPPRLTRIRELVATA